MTFNQSLTPITGANKRTLDIGAIIDPTTAALRSASGVVGAAADVFGAVRGAQNKAAQKAKQEADQSRRDLLFEQGQTDRNSRLQATADKVKDQEELSNFDNAFATELRQFNRSQLSAAQGRGTSSQAQVQVNAQRFVTSLSARFPNQSSRLNDRLRTNGLGHLITGNVDDLQDEHESQREAKQSADTAAHTAALQRGSISPDASFREIVAHGTELQRVETETTRLKAVRDEVRANRSLSVQERDLQDKQLERQLSTAAFDLASNDAGGTASSAVNLALGLTDANFTENVGQIRTLLSTLEARKGEIAEKVGFDPKATERANKVIDNQITFINDLISGDASLVKTRASQVKLLTDSLKTDVLSEGGNLATLYAFSPQSVGQLINLASGKEGIRDELAEEVVGLLSNGKKGDDPTDLKAGLEAIGNPQRLEVLSPRASRRAVTSASATIDSAARQLFSTTSLRASGLTKEQVSVDALKNINTVTVLGHKASIPTQDSHKHVKSMVNTSLSPEVSGILDRIITDRETSPELRQEAQTSLLGARGLAQETVRNTLQQGLDSDLEDHVPRFDPSQGKVVAEFSQENFKKLGDLAGRASGNPFLSGLSGSETAIENTKRRGPTAFVQDRVDILNKSLDFLVATNTHDSASNKSLTPNQIKKAWIDQNFKILHDNPEPPQPTIPPNNNTNEE